MRMQILALTLCVAAFTTSAQAAQGEVCRSEAKAPTVSEPVYPLTNELKFTCPSLGVVMVPEIYQKGWRIVHTWAAGAPRPDGAPMGPVPYINYIALIEKI